MSTPYQIFYDAIPEILKTGHKTHNEIKSQLQKRCPEYCDDSIRCPHTSGNQPEWDHLARNAEQALKRKGIISYDSYKQAWQIVSINKMNQENIKKESFNIKDKKLHEKCRVLTKCIVNISDIYRNSNDDQKRFIETMIGAAVFYLPNNHLWSGKCSEEALKLLKQKEISKLVKEHDFPRKLAAKELLTSELDNLKKSEDRLLELYTTKYGKWNYVTRNENKLLAKYQKDTCFISPADSYSKAGVKLVDSDRSLFKSSGSKVEKAEWV